jgi:hypothetical protein
MAVTDAERQAVLDDPAIVEAYYQDRLAAFDGDRGAALQAVIDAQQEYGLDDSFVTANLISVPADAYTSYKSAVNVGFVPDKTPEPAPAATPAVNQGIVDWNSDAPIKAQLPEGFDWQSYVNQNPDLAQAGIDTPQEAASHYQRYGFGEDRSGVTAPVAPPEVQIPDVDLATALRMNPDLGAAGIDTQQEFNQWYRDFGVNEPTRQYTGFTDQQIKDYENNLLASGMSPAEVQAQVIAEGQKYGVDPTRVQDLLGYSWGADTGTTGTGGTTGVGTGTDVTGGTGGTAGTGDMGGTTGTTGTGGLIGSTPSEMLTPFQKSVMAQNQALLGTYGSTAPNLNPYTQMVANQALSELNRQRQMTQQDIGYQATQAGAFGGSRHGVAEALTNEAFARQGANMLAPLMYQGYQAGVQNELARAAQMGNLGQTSFNYGTSINNMLAGAGAQQQALNQAQIDTAAQQAGAYQAYPATGAGTFSQILGAAPTGQTSSYNPGVMDYLTLAATAYGASDIRLKKNIKKVGELSNGLGVYTWEWKDKVKDLVGNFSMTKGVMAQEAMKVIPEAVVTAPNGYLAVDYSHPELSGVA